MNCHEVEKLLSAYLDRALPERQRVRVAEHLAACGACRKVYESLTVLLRHMKDLEQIDPPADFLEAVNARLEREGALKRTMRRLFLPLRIKLPLEMAAVAVLFVMMFYLAGTRDGRPLREIVTGMDKREIPESRMAPPAGAGADKAETRDAAVAPDALEHKRGGSAPAGEPSPGKEKTAGGRPAEVAPELDRVDKKADRGEKKGKMEVLVAEDRAVSPPAGEPTGIIHEEKVSSPRVEGEKPESVSGSSGEISPNEEERKRLLKESRGEVWEEADLPLGEGSEPAREIELEMEIKSPIFPDKRGKSSNETFRALRGGEKTALAEEEPAGGRVEKIIEMLQGRIIEKRYLPATGQLSEVVFAIPAARFDELRRELERIAGFPRPFPVIDGNSGEELKVRLKLNYPPPDLPPR
ncbi:MAG: DUF2275 domain-containing protein [Candidatus Krumholzibacteriota bacterium]|nr:DUF2275 domain-containing protein [Candidatus Krumholzibacteriota bacterium]